MALYLIAAFILAVFLLLLLPVRVEFELLLSPMSFRWRVTVRALGGLARFRLNSADIQNMEREAGKIEQTKLGRAVIKNCLFRRGEYLCMERFSARGRIGVDNNAAQTAMASGMIGVLLQTILPLLLPCQSKPMVHIRPEFRFFTFWFYMEGILTLLPAKIIPILWKTIKSEGMNHVTSSGKYHEKHHGAAAADGGR